jgi:hypothetical protein
MAVQNYKTNYDADAGAAYDALGPQSSFGVTPKTLQSPTVSILAADDDGSTFMLFKSIPKDSVLASLGLEHSAITGGTSYDVGLYNGRTGAVIDKDCLAAALDLTAAATKNAPKDGLKDVTHANTRKALWELSGLSFAACPDIVDVVLTANTIGTAAGSVTARASLISGGN